jgi:sugar/nucleoside kinase (ribokinase family)
MHWHKELAYTITPKSGPMRRMETLLDANRAFVQDLPRALFKKPDWLHVGKLLVLAAETGHPMDIREATEELLEIINRHGWMITNIPAYTACTPGADGLSPRAGFSPIECDPPPTATEVVVQSDQERR